MADEHAADQQEGQVAEDGAPLKFSEEVLGYMNKLDAAPVISWEDALGQVDDDREFLFELLQDLYREGRAHVEQAIEFYQTQFDVKQIQMHAHAVKGAAANVMCYRLRWAAAAVEHSCKDQMAGKITEDEVRAILADRLPVFIAEFSTFMELLQVNNLMPEEEEVEVEEHQSMEAQA